MLSLGNRSINIKMIYKPRVFDISWCLITLIIYVQTLKRLLGELTRGYDTSVKQWVSIGLDYGLVPHILLGKFIVNYRRLLEGYVSLGRVVPRHQPLKHVVAWQQVNQYKDDLQTSSLWYQLMSHYTDNLCANFEEAPGRAHKRIRYVC